MVSCAKSYEFLSPYGIRSVSKIHQTPYELSIGGKNFSIEYWPAESRGELFGGNSNWRGPIWLPINYLLIEALRKYHRYYGDEFQVACPTGSKNVMTLDQIANELSRRLESIFLHDENGKRPVFGELELFQTDEHWRNYVQFHEYFHGDIGFGLGASHQTGWTGLMAALFNRD